MVVKSKKNYSRDEIVKLVYAIGEAHGSCLLATRIDKANNSNLPRYSRTDCFGKPKERFEGTEYVNYEKNTRTHVSSNQNTQIDVVVCAVQNPSTSVTGISDEIGISKSVVQRTLKKNKFHPYRIEHHQFLTKQYFQKRIEFRQWAQQSLKRM